MSKYRKRPVVVEATQVWTRTEAVAAGACPGGGQCKGTSVYGEQAPLGHIHTLEGDHGIIPGDFVITGVKGERYPCKPDIFAATYEAVDG